MSKLFMYADLILIETFLTKLNQIEFTTITTVFSADLSSDNHGLK